MIRYFVLTAMTLGLQLARAEEIPKPTDTVAVNEKQAEPGRSFFETRTIEDMQKLVTVEAAMMDPTNEPSSGS